MATKGSKRPRREDPVLTGPKPEFILALDLSLTGTGVAWYSHSRKLQDSEVWCPPDDLRGAARLKWIHDQIMNQFLDRVDDLAHLYTKHVFLEGYAFGRANQAHQLGELGGVVRFALHQADVPFTVVAPTMVKKFLSGKGNANKNVMLKELYKRFGHDVDDDNRADALALLELAKMAFGFSQATPTLFQTKVLEDLAKSALKVA